MSAALHRLGRSWEVAVFLQVPAVTCVWLVWRVAARNGGRDFVIFRDAGRAVLHGHSPYVRPTLELLATNDHFVYPTPFAIPFIPFAVAPAKVGAVIFLVLSLVAVL